MVKVFIENEAGSNKKNLFDEKTLGYKNTVIVARAYPYPYGFILETTSGDGDNLDCFVITKQNLKTNTIVEVEPIAMVEVSDTGEEDHKILARLSTEQPIIDIATQERLTEFMEHVFDHLPRKKLIVGRFLDSQAANALIQQCGV